MEYMVNQMDDLITGANLQQEESNSFKLISMTDYVLKQEQNHIQTFADKYMICRFYAQFLKQPLTLGMFVPCDEEGNVWKFPPTQEEWEWCEKDSTEAEQSFKQKEFYYQQAKERVLFEGCFLNFKGEVIVKETDFQTLKYAESNWTIEDLIQFDLTLTETAIKQIGL